MVFLLVNWKYRRCVVALPAPNLHWAQDSRPDGADWTNPERPYILSVEDPKDATNDICR